MSFSFDSSALADGVDWSVLVLDASGAVLFERDADWVLSTASAPKVLLLAAVAAEIAAGRMDADELLDRRSTPRVEDSGIWQHLRQDMLCVDDVCTLVGTVSDNWATNLLIERVGLDAVAAFGARLGVGDVHLHDLARGRRTPDMPPRLSSASARGLAMLLHRIRCRTLLGETDAMVERWLHSGVDLSMVASAFNLDPLAHADGAASLQLVSKTGTNEGVRVDTGWVRASDRALTYAVLANWDAGDDRVGDVLASMRAVGAAVRGALG